jgi:predicted branched-subunit amino acid permease
VVMAATVFAGSAQFAALAVLGGGGGALAAAAAGVLLNARYGPIGLSVAPHLRGGAWWRFVQSQLVVDESWAISSEGEGRYNPAVLLGSGLTIYAAWVLGTILGSVFGDVLGDPAALGLDAAFPALFLALLAPQLGGSTAKKAAALGAVIALALTPVAPPGVPIIAASAACLVGWRR